MYIGDIFGSVAIDDIEYMVRRGELRYLMKFHIEDSIWTLGVNGVISL
jgi:hypothetical protein